jgi:cell division protein FtsA
MEGAIELAEEIFHMPVRLGSPQGVAGLHDIVRNPIYATGVGLLQYGLDRQNIKGRRSGRSAPGMLQRIKQWFQGNF